MTKSKISLIQQPVSIIVLLIVIAINNTVRAEIDLTGLYTGVQFSNTEYRLKSDDNLSESWGHIKGKLGKSLNELFSLEGHFGATTNTDSGHGVFTYGAYLRIGKDIGQYKPYGLLGVSGFHLYEDGIEDQTEASASYGVGLEIFGSKDMTVTVEYLRLIDKSVNGDDLTLGTLGLGFTYYFSSDTSHFNKNRNKIQSIRY